MALLGFGCQRAVQSPPQRAEAAKALYEQTTKVFQLPSSDAAGAERQRLLSEAAAGYEKLLKQYPEQAAWCAQALLALGNIQAVQTNIPGAVKLYTEVDQKYPHQEWEVLMGLKSAADLLWDAGRRDDAKGLYQRIVQRFDGTNQPPVIQLTVQGSKRRLGGEAR